MGGGRDWDCTMAVVAKLYQDGRDAFHGGGRQKKAFHNRIQRLWILDEGD